MADEKLGMLIDYEWCTGCHTCEVGCKERFELDEDEWGIKLAEVGPWKHGKHDFEWTFVPIPTEQCNMCRDRIEKGKKPLCELQCQSLVITVGPVDELAKKLGTKDKLVLFTETKDTPRKEPVY